MATCPKGHQSATADYCDVCGAPIDPAASPAAPAVVPPPEPPAGPGAKGAPCPTCDTPRTGRFCEVCGYDFLLAPPAEPNIVGDAVRSAPPEVAPAPRPDGVPATPSDGVPATSADGAHAPAAPPGAAGSAGGWHVVVGADRAYFAAIQAMAGEDAGALAFPPFVAERRFPLSGDQMLIGRRSRSRGVQPDIDLVGPPEDPGVSHVHALLVAQPDGWAVVDLESANGTYLNDHGAQPLDPNTPVPVKDGDRIYVGAWTFLTIRTVG